MYVYKYTNTCIFGMPINIFTIDWHRAGMCVLQLVWAQDFGSQHFSSLLLAMLVVICIPKDKIMWSAIHESQLSFMFFVPGLCVECYCSLECSAGWHGVSGLLPLKLLVPTKVFNCNSGFLIVRMLCRWPEPKPKSKQQAHVTLNLQMFCNVSECLPRCQYVRKVAKEMKP